MVKEAAETFVETADKRARLCMSCYRLILRQLLGCVDAVTIRAIAHHNEKNTPFFEQISVSRKQQRSRGRV